jgi:glucose-1-phosphate adenylyltransferase
MLQSAMIIGADFFESEEQRAKLLAAGKVPIGIGDGTIIENAIIDKNARIGKNCVIVNAEGIDEADREADGYFIRSGIICVLRNAEIKDGTVI